MPAPVDVYIAVPTGGGTGEETVLLAEGVDVDVAELIGKRSVRPVHTVASPPDRDADEQPDEVVPADPEVDSVGATEYFAWMRLSPTGGKVPWSMVAHRIAPDEVAVFRSGLRRMSVQPMPRTKPVE
ncbi:hypothetical protein FHR81_005250 [Actinoalloteichus hoggarensis]|nr:hypothetical protein [Actinoalloteichus hoggarensis]MBB5924173.1 hypothetical protein [Actinoalloteichus hoggarensis]